MAKYFLDTEFIAGFNKPVFGKKRHFIDLISIGLVDEAGREYSAISKDFNPSDADDWVKENVLKPIVDEFIHRPLNDIMYRNLWRLDGKTIVGQINLIQQWIGKTDKQIARDIRNFVYAPALAEGEGMDGSDADIDWWLKKNTIDFYAYFADYDWVLFCSLFGRMIDLPTGFPQYCNDLKQSMEEKGLSQAWKRMNCPDPINEHNALSDAQWTKKLYYCILKETKS